MIDLADLENRTSHHQLSDKGTDRVLQMRALALDAAQAVTDLVPEGREQSLALTKIEEFLFWSNAGIARHPDFQANEDRS